MVINRRRVMIIVFRYTLQLLTRIIQGSGVTISVTNIFAWAASYSNFEELNKCSEALSLLLVIENKRSLQCSETHLTDLDASLACKGRWRRQHTIRLLKSAHV